MTVPNILTFLRILLTPIFLLLLLRNNITEAFIVFFIAGLTDGLDGFIARAFKQKSLLGAFLDPVADKILLVSAFIALSWLNIVPWWLAGIVIARDLAIITGASLLILADVPFEVKPSIAGKVTTLLQLLTVIGALLSRNFPINHAFLWLLFMLSTLMTGISGWDYTKKWALLWKTSNGYLRLIHRFVIRLSPIWYGEKKVPYLLQISLTFPYLAAVAIHRLVASLKKTFVRSFVISVGNLLVGGTGKTPFTIQLAKALSTYGLKVAIVTRSFGKAKFKTPEKVTPSNWNTGKYGDEPILISTYLPDLSVWVGQSKSKTTKIADITEQPDVIIVDDGYQHWQLERNLDIVLLDTERCIGNGSVLPLGPLREHPSALRRADIVVFVGPESSISRACLYRVEKYLSSDVKIFHCRRHIAEIVLSGQSFPVNLFRGNKCCAFAGIADPERFFSDLERHGINIVNRLTFPDHYLYRTVDIERIVDEAHRSSAQLIITTEKDFIRLPEDTKKFIAYARLYFGDEEIFTILGLQIKQLLKNQRGGRDAPYHFER